MGGLHLELSKWMRKDMNLMSKWMHKDMNHGYAQLINYYDYDIYKYKLLYYYWYGNLSDTYVKIDTCRLYTSAHTRTHQHTSTNLFMQLLAHLKRSIYQNER